MSEAAEEQTAPLCAGRVSVFNPGFWDYSCLDPRLLQEAASLDAQQVRNLARPGFDIRMDYGSLASFWLAEAAEYTDAWAQSTPEKPVGVCGPIGPTEQLPLVAELVNAQGRSLADAGAVFWGMDEWVLGGDAELGRGESGPGTGELRMMPASDPLSFEGCDRRLCFDKMHAGLAPSEKDMWFPSLDNLESYSAAFDGARCALMQGGQGEVKHWAFNDPPQRREGETEPMPVNEYMKLGARKVDLHPLTVVQNARGFGGAAMMSVPRKACTVGPIETMKADKVSIWHAGFHDNALGMRLTSLMISKKMPSTAVPMSLLALHPNVVFNFAPDALGSCALDWPSA
jgi:glucosamine-6-phosphate deaminase